MRKLDDDAFAEELEAWVSNGYSYGHPPIRVMQTPFSLQLIGMKDLPIYIDPSKLSKIMLVDHPEITLEVLKQLPQSLRNPMMIFRSKTQSDRIVASLSLKDTSGIEILVPFVLDQPKAWEQANVITSIYAKEDHGHPRYKWYIDCINAGLLLYAHREKAAQFLTSAGVQFPMEEQTNGFLTYRIKDENDLVKYKKEKERLISSMQGSDEELWREKDYHEQLSEIRGRIEELGRETQSQFPEEFVRCLSVSEEFFAALDDLRDEAATQSHDIGDQMLTASHTAAEEMYYSIKLAPTKVRAHLDRCAHDAVRDVLSAVADSFAYHTMAVEHRRAEILKAEDHTKDAVQETKEQREEKTR